MARRTNYGFEKKQKAEKKRLKKELAEEGAPVEGAAETEEAQE